MFRCVILRLETGTLGLADLDRLRLDLRSDRNLTLFAPTVRDVSISRFALRRAGIWPTRLLSERDLLRAGRYGLG
jgi:hypothetical protein